MPHAYVRLKATLFIFTIFLVLVSCSTSDEIAVYENVDIDRPLVVPPDIVMPSQNSALTVPEIAPSSTTYKIYSQKKSNGASELLKPQHTGIKLRRDGAIQWLEIDAKPKDIWNKAIKFFEQTGFKIKIKEPQLGIIETGWLVNRTNVPTNWFAQVFQSLYSKGQLDKYRVRLERNEDDTRTLMFLTHRGGRTEEITTFGEVEEIDETKLRWIPTESDFELEAEMLQRFLVYAGNSETETAKEFLNNKVEKRTTLVEKDGTVNLLVVKEIFPRTWRRTGLAIDRLGFAVEDRDRSAGIYYIQISEKFIESEKKDENVVSNLFSKKKHDITQFLISLEDKGDETYIHVLTRQGDENKSPLQKVILEKLDELLK